MISRSQRRVGRRVNPGAVGPVAALSLVALLVVADASRADSYLDAIELEVDKVDKVEEAVPEAPAEPEQAKARFEQELEQRYRGSFLFYRKLPPKSRQEVFSEYERGASIEDVRRTIMSRFLHSR